MSEYTALNVCCNARREVSRNRSRDGLSREASVPLPLSVAQFTPLPETLGVEPVESRRSNQSLSSWEHLVDVRKNRSSFRMWWDQAEVINEKSAIESLAWSFREHTSEMKDAHLWQQIEKLFFLELAFAEIPEAQFKYLRDIVSCVVEEVESALHPVPDEKKLQEFYQDLASILEKDFGTGKSLKEWAKEKRFSQAEAPENLLDQVRPSFVNLRRDYDRYPVLSWFAGCFLLQLSQGKYAQFEDPAFGSMLSEMFAEKEHMKWSVLGWVAGALIKSGILDSTDFSLGSIKRRHLMKLSASVMPRAGFELTRLIAVLEDQLLRVQSMKHKMLAAASCAALGAAQALGKAVVDYHLDFGS